MGFDPARVVQIWSPAVPGHRSSDGPVGEGSGAGSGYRVDENLVLTAAHVVVGHPVSDPVEGVPTSPVASGSTGVEVAVLGSSTWVSAVVVWRDEEADVAVLYATGLSGLPVGSPAPRWGIVTGQEAVECMAVGFPWASVTPHELRDAEHMVGFIPPVSGAVIGAQAITVRSSPPLPRGEGGSPWAGMSGAGVFCGRYLVGVIVVAPPRYGTDRLRAVPLAPLLEDNSEVRDLLGAQAELEPVQLPSRLAITDHDSIGLRPAYRSLPVGMDLHSAAVQLLLAEHGVVPFSGRADQLNELQQWCRQDRPVALRVITGEGGSGKTRLAAELCTVMAVDGWDTGFAEPDLPGGDTALEYDRATLVVVDEADRHVDLLAKLLPRLAYRHSAAPPLRLLLVARTTLGWWDQLNRRTKSTADGYAGRQPPLQLTNGQLPLEQRLHHYREAYHRFRQFHSGQTAPLPCTDNAVRSGTESRAVEGAGFGVGGDADAFPLGLELSDPTFANPLLVHMTALLAAFSDITEGLRPSFPEGQVISDSNPAINWGAEENAREKILRSVLDREKQRWVEDPAYPTDAAGYPDDTTADQAVTMATLVTPATEKTAIQLLITLPWLKESDEAQRRAVARWLHRLYPGPDQQWVVPLRPDLLAEELLATTNQLNDIVDALLGQLVEAGENAAVSQLLGELVGAGRRAPVHQALDHLLDVHLPVMLDHAMLDATGQMSASLDRALQLAPQPVQALEQVDRLPERSIILASLALTLTEQSVDHLRAQVATAPEAFTPALAGALHNLANRLGALGRREEALAAAEEATRLCRGLVAGRPEAFAPALASALSNFSGRLGELGRREEAVGAAEEAVKLRRISAAAQPDVFAADLAVTLTNLATALAHLGRREEALEAIEEATKINRDLVAVLPEAVTPALALALSNLANRLGELGRREEALEAAEEATTIYRTLVTVRPEAFTPEFAGALNNLGIAFGVLGRREDALEAAEESTTIYRTLVTVRPEAFTPDLAGVLNNLANSLGELGRREEALEAVQEAVKLRRIMVAVRPEAFTPDLAGGLNNLANRLSELGRLEEALEAVHEATTLYRDLAAVRSEAFIPHLADTLNNLANTLGQLGRREEALEAIEEATRIYRSLVAVRSETFTPDLAHSLSNLSNALGTMGRREEALESAEEATRLYRTLIAVLPEAFTPDLALALINLANALGDLGRQEESLDAIEEATEIYRNLAATRPEKFTPTFAGALNNLANALGDLGQQEEALKAVEEASWLYRALVAERPEVFSPDLARTLNNRAICLGDANRLEEALEAAEEATRLYRTLVAVLPEAFIPDLASTLSNLANALVQLGRREEALGAIDEATKIYRKLAAVHPEVFTLNLAQGLANMGVLLTELGRLRGALHVDRLALVLFLRLAEENSIFFEDAQKMIQNLLIVFRNLGYTVDEAFRELESIGIKLD